jgi:transposase
MTTTQGPREQRLYVAIETSNTKWRLGFSDGGKIRQVNIDARSTEQWSAAVERAKQKLGLSAETAVWSCYEAGRDGFWIHRWLVGQGVRNVVVDAASIEVKQGRRRVKTDRVDAEKLVRMLMRYGTGEKTVWSVVRVPGEAEEDERRKHRELERLKKERTGHVNRIRSLLILVGVNVEKIKEAGKRLEAIRCWDGRRLPEGLKGELDREFLRLRQVEEQIKALEKEQEQRLKAPTTETERKARKLVGLRGVGPVSSWLLSHEVFGWRQFRNRRELGSMSGLVGTPYQSGESSREQGISKAGNRRVRHVMVELAWMWLRYQPESELSRWFWQRFGYGGRRMRRVGIVALARKLLVALWKYVEQDQMPAGAVMARG